MQHFTKFLSFLLLVVIMTGLVPAGIVQAQTIPGIEFSNTIEYLKSQQQTDGGFPGLSEVSDPGTTARALIAFHAIGIDPQQFVSSEGLTPIDYLLDTYQGYIYDDNQLLFPGNAGLILAALSFSQSAPEDLPAFILDTLQEDGSFSTEAAKDWNSGLATDLSQALAILGLAAHGDPIPAVAVDYLLVKQLQDGTWDNGFGSDPDTTALVVVALLASGQVDQEHDVIQAALQYFKDTQLENAAWRPMWDSSMINVDTTGWITLALVSAGEDLVNWRVDNNSPRDALHSAIQEDGSIGVGFINVYSTVEALLGFSQGPLVEPLTPQVETINKAGLAVTLPDGNTILRCVEFSGESISGFEFLESSGLVLETVFDPAMGNAVCGIEGQGCESDNCFCGMPNYWSYWHLDPQGEEWAYSMVGANTHEVTAGSVDGWSWGEEPPTLVSYDNICGENPQLFLPAMVKEDQQTTSSVLLPLVENAGDTEEVTSEPTETEPVAESNLSQYLVFGIIVLGLIAVLVLVLREKRKV
ncbi:MAG: terpene cyclase/mutase family protein [Anaerolineaceae bacterium]|nr:terpene cyclase/mutase family protein [Anaerolineaceae bacterium]